jgi:predicted DNA-binding transcriptional regulator AlpA
MRSPLPSQETDPPRRQLVPDAQVRAELGGVSSMTIHRWDNDETLQFPRPIVIRGRKFRWRHEVEDFKSRLIEATTNGSATTIAPIPHRRAAKSRMRCASARAAREAP